MASYDEAEYEKAVRAIKSSGPHTLTAVHAEKNLSAFQKVKDLLPFDDIYKVSDADLVYRFLIGRHWREPDAIEMIRHYITVRKEENINSILGETFPDDLLSTTASFYGVDMDNRPILWFKPDPALILPVMKKYEIKSVSRANYRQSEQARFLSLALGADRCTYVMDLEKITLSSVKMTTVGFVKEVVKVLQLYYPEIMFRILVCNGGWALKTGWKLLQPFVDPRVQDKIQFFTSSPGVECLAKFISSENIHPNYGGTGGRVGSDGDKMFQLLQREHERIKREGPVPFLRSPNLNKTPTVITSLLPPSPSACSDDPMLYTCNSSFVNEFVSSRNSVEQQNQPSFNNLEKPLESPVVSEANIHCDPRDPLPQFCPLSRIVPKRTTSELAGAMAVEGIACKSPTERIPKAITAFERCSSLTLNYTADGEVHCMIKGKCCAILSKSRVYACLFSSGVDNDDQDDGKAGLEVHDKFSPPLVPFDSQGHHRQCLNDNASLVSPASSMHTVPDASAVPDDTIQEASKPRADDRTSFRGARDQPLAPPLREKRTILCGEILHEAGHYLHKHLLVCDGERRVNFILRQSWLRQRITVYVVLGRDREVRTSTDHQHYFVTDASSSRLATSTGKKKSERASLQFDLPQNELIAHEEEKFSREALHVGTVIAPRSSLDKEAWIMLSTRAFIRSSQTSALEAAKNGGSLSGNSLHRRRQHLSAPPNLSRTNARSKFPAILQQLPESRSSSVMIGEHHHQKLMFYGDLAYWYEPHDLFALGISITQLWRMEK